MVSRRFVAAALLCGLSIAPAAAQDDSASAPPFPIRDQNPFIQIFGIPATESARFTNRPGVDAAVLIDITNNSMIDDAGSEEISIDGETYRTAIVLRKRLTENTELALELPFIAHRPGVMDNFIEGWHDTFGLSNAERSKTPSNTLDYHYKDNGTRFAGFSSGNSGLADISLKAGYRIYDEPGRALSARAALKLPTGDAEQLRGSEAADLALYLSAADDNLLPGLESYAQAGLVLLGKGEVLAERQNSSVAFAGVGVTWRADSWIDLKAQIDTHSSVYDSELRQLGSNSIQLTVGGTLYFGSDLALDIGVGENLFTDTTPDFLINLVLRRL